MPLHLNQSLTLAIVDCNVKFCKSLAKQIVRRLQHVHGTSSHIELHGLWLYALCCGLDGYDRPGNSCSHLQCLLFAATSTTALRNSVVISNTREGEAQLERRRNGCPEVQQFSKRNSKWEMFGKLSGFLFKTWKNLTQVRSFRCNEYSLS